MMNFKVGQQYDCAKNVRIGHYKYTDSDGETTQENAWPFTITRIDKDMIFFTFNNNRIGWTVPWSFDVEVTNNRWFLYKKEATRIRNRFELIFDN